MRTSIACEGLTEQLLDGTSPSWRASFSAKQNMVDVAQLVSASDCGSEGRGFDSHHPPHKRKAPHAGAFLLWNPVNDGSRRERPAQRAGKKVSGGHFFSSGETPAIHPIKEKHPYAGAFLLWNPVNDGSRRERPARRAGKKCPVDLFLARGRVPLSTPDKLPDLIPCQIR